MLPFREAVGVAPSAGVMLIATSVLAAISAPELTGLPLAVIEEVPVPVRLMVSLGTEGVTEPVLPELPPVLLPELSPPVSEPVEEPPVFEPEPPLTVIWPVVVVPSALMVVCWPYSFTMMMTVLSPARALRVMVSGQGPASHTSQ